MAISPARLAAYEILLQVDREGAYAAELLHSDRYRALKRNDLDLCTLLVMGVLRWRSRLDDKLASVATTPLAKCDAEVLAALRMGAFQLRFMDRVPDHAVVNDSVQLVRRARKTSAAPFVNAVLRKLAAGGKKSHVEPDELAQRYAHPDWIVRRWMAKFGEDRTEGICQYDQTVPRTVARVWNDSAKAALERAGFTLSKTDLLVRAVRIDSGDIHSPSIKTNVALQDEGSQLVGLLAGRGKRILDCCAAPGGKTRILAQRNPEAEVVAVELHEHRAQLLRSLVREQNVRVVCADIRTFRDSLQFDVVLVDAPCSGTGTLARNPEIKWRLKPEDLRSLSERQREILAAAASHATSGGLLVYSTCSLEREEGEDVIDEFLSRKPGFELVDCREKLRELFEEGELQTSNFDPVTTGSYLRTVPGVNHFDGFFAAVMRRT